MSNDRRRITLPAVVMRPDPVSDLSSYPVLALFDTGATTSGITPKVVDALGLLGMGKRPIALLKAMDRRRDISFASAFGGGRSGSGALPFVFDAIMGFGLNSGFRFDILLGMDILSQCDFRMDRLGHALLSFG